MGGYYLLDNPPRSPQYRSPRRDRVSGLVIVHNSGGARTDALNLARFIENRGDPGSYHELGNHADDWVVMLPDDVEAFGTTAGDNRWGWHVCLTGSDGSFVPTDPATVRGIDQAAARAAAFWRRQAITPRLDRFLTYTEAHDQRQPGLVHHGTLQPGDRSDAWAKSPRRPALDGLLLAACRRHLNLTPPPPKEVPAMARNIILRNADGRGEEFGINRDGLLRQRWQNPTGAWQEWVPFVPAVGGAVEEVAGWVTADGRLEVVARNYTWGWHGRAWQTSPGGTWDGWAPA